MAIEHFFEKVFDTGLEMGDHLGKENRIHHMTHFDGTQSETVNGFVDFATSHPFLLLGGIAAVGLIKALTDD